MDRRDRPLVDEWMGPCKTLRDHCRRGAAVLCRPVRTCLLGASARVASQARAPDRSSRRSRARREECPKYALHAMPKDLLTRLRELPFVPPLQEVRKLMVPAESASKPSGASGFFGRTRNASSAGMARRAGGGSTSSAPVRLQGWRGDAEAERTLATLQRQLQAHARQHLTTAAVARHVINRTLGADGLRALHRVRTTRGGRAVRGGAVNASEAAARARAQGLRVLLLSESPHDDQMTALHDGLAAIGAEVDARLPKGGRAKRSHGRRDRSSSTTRASSENERAQLVAAHALAPYALIIAQLSGDGLDEELAQLTGALTSEGAQRARAERPVRVACVHSAQRPRPTWQLWIPDFCTTAFVREMRLL